MTSPASMLTQDGTSVRRLRDRFLRLTIARKMLLGYLMLVALIFLISLFSLSSLQRLNVANRGIVMTDVPIIETSEAMIDALISEELYSRRCAILQSPEMLALARKKNAEFDGLTEKLRSLLGKGSPADLILPVHQEYGELFEKVMSPRNSGSLSGANLESSIRLKQEKIITILKDISARARQNQYERTVAASNIGRSAFSLTIALCIMSVVVSIAATLIITRNIAGAITRLKEASAKISEGKFELIEGIHNKDELGELSLTFNEMTKRLKWLETTYLDASPLTRLPGNIAIENVLKKRIESGAQFAFCHIDMDNFKAFSDRYGYAKGSEIILATAKMIEQAVSEAGMPEDFVGHIGGDDFVLITTPDHFRATCRRIIQIFDKNIPEYYDPEDRERGFILGKSRQGVPFTFPIMSISIAVVTNVQRSLVSNVQVGELAAELKEYAKSLPGSVYVVDRRRKDGIEVQEHA